MVEIKLKISVKEDKEGKVILTALKIDHEDANIHEVIFAEFIHLNIKQTIEMLSKKCKGGFMAEGKNADFMIKKHFPDLDNKKKDDPSLN